MWSGVAHPAISRGEDLPDLVYTAIPRAGTDHATVALARPVRGRDGVAWDQPDHGVTAPAPGDIRDVRDPFLFTWQGRRYAIQGAGTRSGEPVVLLYDAHDLQHWQLLGPLLRGSDPIAASLAPGQLWECPQLVELDGTWVLILSLWDDTAPGAAGHGPQRVAWIRGELSQRPGGEPGPAFTATGGGPLDSGTAMYAPQAVVDTTSTPPRTLAWGWVWEGTRSAPPPGQAPRDWAGCLTVPRELTMMGGHLRSAFAGEIIAAFGEPAPHAGPIEASTWLARVRGEVAATVRVEVGTPGSLRTVWEGEGHAVDLLFDGSILEVMADGVATTVRSYPAPDEVLRVSATTPDGEAPVMLATLR